jgi:methyl coenzyme M reductase beta subunit
MTQQHNSTITGHRQPPAVDFAKCNLYAVVFMTEQKGGMGACLRDINNFILAMTTHN